MNVPRKKSGDARVDQSPDVELETLASSTSLPWLTLGFFAANIIPLLLLVDTIGALRRGWSPEHHLDRLLIGVVFFWAVGGVATLRLQRARVFYSRNPVKLLLMVGTIALSLLGGERLLESTKSSVEPPFHHHIPNQVRHHVYNSTAYPGITGETTISFNSRGVRGPELAAHYGKKVLCIGGSTTINGALDDSETWSQVLMDLLNGQAGDGAFWVGNVGKSGYATPQHLKYVRTSDQLTDYDVAVFLIGANDFSVPLVWVSLRRQTSPPEWQKTEYYRVAKVIVSLAFPTINPMGADPTGANMEFRRRRRANTDRILSYSGLDINNQVWVGSYAKKIARIIETCRERGVQPIFATQPTLWSHDPEPEEEALMWAGGVRGNSRFISIPKAKDYLDSYNDALRSVCAARSVPCVDLDHMNGNLDFFWDDFHFTELGARTVAAAIAEELLKLDSAK